MAHEIMMKNPQTGILKRGYYGFSWTSLFFGGLPAILRGDVVVGIIVLVATAVTFGAAGIIWAFCYNKRYTRGLVSQGYQFVGNPQEIQDALVALGYAKASDQPQRRPYGGPPMW